MSSTYTIIVTYNGASYIEACLHSLKGNHVIVVDNNSTDDTCTIIEGNFPEVHLLKQSKNHGFGVANNIGIQKAYELGASHFFLLNQDAKVATNTLSVLADYQNKFPEYGILSPLHLYYEGDLLDRAFTTYITPDRNERFLSDFILDREKLPIYQVDFVAAACWMISRSCVETVGGFDPIFFYLGEDLNYCQRCVFHGIKIGVVPEVQVYHDTKGRTFRTPLDYSTAYFKNKEKQWQILFANPNTPTEALEKQKAHYLKKNKVQLVKAITLFKLSLARNLKKERRFFELTYENSLNSRRTSSKKGLHYLNF